MSTTRTSARNEPNLLTDPAVIDLDHGDGPGRITRYGAGILGRALGHALTLDGDDDSTAEPWAEYGRLLWPALTSSPVRPPFAWLVDAASDVLDVLDA